MLLFALEHQAQKETPDAQAYRVFRRGHRRGVHYRLHMASIRHGAGSRCELHLQRRIQDLSMGLRYPSVYLEMYKVDTGARILITNVRGKLRDSKSTTSRDFSFI